MSKSCRGNCEKALRAFTKKWGDCEFIGEGGNSWIFRINDKGTFKAIKMLRRLERYERFKNEIKITSRMDEINGVVCPEFVNLPKKMVNLGDQDFNIDEIPFFIMPFFSKGNLRQQILNHELKFPNNRIAEVFLSICNVIEKIHSKNFAHRDLKPENILIDENEKYYISDFGLSIDLDTGVMPMYRHTNDREIIGSIDYRAPEYLRGKLDDSDHRPGDIFSLGRILWAIACRREPTMITDLVFQQTDVRINNSEIENPELLNKIIKSATEIDPNNRPTISNIIIAMKEWMESFMNKKTSKLNSSQLRNKIINSQSYIDKTSIQKKLQDADQELNAANKYVSQFLKSTEMYSNLKEIEIGTVFVAGGTGSIRLRKSTINSVYNSSLVYKPKYASGVMPHLAVGANLGYDDVEVRDQIYIEVFGAIGIKLNDISEQNFGVLKGNRFDSTVMAQIQEKLESALEWVEERFNLITS